MTAFYLYHRVPGDLSGTTLHPLNRLRDIHPDLYATKVAGYGKRSEVIRMRVPILDCLWNDVLFFSPVHPEKICRLRVETGYPRVTRTYFEVDPDQAGMNAGNTVIFLHKIYDPDDYILPEEDFIPFSTEHLKDLTEIPEKTVNYYRDTFRQGKRPLVYLFVPQVMYLGTLDVRNLKVLEIQ